MRFALIVRKLDARLVDHRSARGQHRGAWPLRTYVRKGIIPTPETFDRHHTQQRRPNSQTEEAHHGCQITRQSRLDGQQTDRSQQPQSQRGSDDQRFHVWNALAATSKPGGDTPFPRSGWAAWVWISQWITILSRGESPRLCLLVNIRKKRLAVIPCDSCLMSRRCYQTRPRLSPQRSGRHLPY